jgi:hypothetical protein
MPKASKNRVATVTAHSSRRYSLSEDCRSASQLLAQQSHDCGVRPTSSRVATPLHLAQRKTSMQLTQMGHSCIRIQRECFVTVIDPGILCAPDVADGADALLISQGNCVGGRCFQPRWPSGQAKRNSSVAVAGSIARIA